jgi:hypothetical protein
MIQRDTLTQQWIDKVSRANRNADKILVEKAIRALLLLEGLANSPLTFIFKGGTALMLLLNSPKRLSIDIDVIVAEEPDNIEEILNSFAEGQGFSKVEMQDRKKASYIEKAHFKFFYSPIHKSHKGDDYILLDILFEANHYRTVSAHSLQSQFVNSIGKAARFQMPSAEDLLGDKLTAFAPNTTGVPYIRNGNSMTMEVIKQLYDIGNLVDVVTDLTTLKITYDKIVKAELAYRGMNDISPTDVLEDTYQTSLCITLRGSDGFGDYEALLKGVERVRGFIFSEAYYLEKAISDAAKAAYMSQLIASKATDIEKFNDPKQIADATIEAPHNTRLQKLKKSDPEAFFYWWKATLLRTNR